MSESSEEKTKRKLSAFILNHAWTHQYSIFYEDNKEGQRLLQDSNKLKKSLKKRYPDLPFLVCYRTKYNAQYGGLQAYAIIFSTKKIKDMLGIAEGSFSASIRYRNRKASRKRLESTARAIRNQRLHDLERFFGRKIRRYSIINKSELDRFKVHTDEDQHGKPQR